MERIDASPAFAHAAAEKLAQIIRHAIREHGNCIIGLSGGSTPGPVYEELAKEMIDWARVSIFLVDDRCVSSDHPDSNQQLIRSSLLSRLHTQPHLIFHDTSLPPDEAAAQYDERLKELLTDRHADLVVLGMGPDGHIASLFPPLGDEASGPAYAIHTTTNVFTVHDRVSVTLPVLTTAGHAVFLLKGDDKKSLWAEMETSDENVQRWPAKALLAAGNVTLITD